jgi:hypothetical protein
VRVQSANIKKGKKKKIGTKFVSMYAPHTPRQVRIISFHGMHAHREDKSFPGVPAHREAWSTHKHISSRVNAFHEIQKHVCEI